MTFPSFDDFGFSAPLTLRPAEPEERWPVRCNARRGRRSRISCEMPALHCRTFGHVGRGRNGQWFVWNDGGRLPGEPIQPREPAVRSPQTGTEPPATPAPPMRST